MDIYDYCINAERTRSERNPLDVDENISAILHAIMGISTEGGELLDVFKKNLFYGKPLDHVNLDEEIGDVLWYIAIYCNAKARMINARNEADGMGDTSRSGHDVWQEIMNTNIEKLRARFPQKFNEVNALVRDLSKERKILEGRAD